MSAELLYYAKMITETRASGAYLQEDRVTIDRDVWESAQMLAECSPGVLKERDDAVQSLRWQNRNISALCAYAEGKGELISIPRDSHHRLVGEVIEKLHAKVVFLTETLGRVNKACDIFQENSKNAADLWEKCRSLEAELASLKSGGSEPERNPTNVELSA